MHVVDEPRRCELRGDWFVPNRAGDDLRRYRLDRPSRGDPTGTVRACRNQLREQYTAAQHVRGERVNLAGDGLGRE
jgi:hypothetical protein